MPAGSSTERVGPSRMRPASIVPVGRMRRRVSAVTSVPRSKMRNSVRIMSARDAACAQAGATAPLRTSSSIDAQTTTTARIIALRPGAPRDAVLSYGRGMDVFLVPVGSDRYALYCEVPDEDPSGADPDHDRGLFRSLVQRFREVLARMERERQTDEPPAPTWWARLKARARRAVAESIAEQ